MVDGDSIPPRREPSKTWPPIRFSNGNVKWIALAITAILGGGGGATWLSMMPGQAASAATAQIEKLEAQIAVQKEKRLGGIEQRLEKIEAGQGRVWRALSKIGSKLKVKDMDEDE